MTTTKETCPKCGAVYDGFGTFACGSMNSLGQFIQMPHCLALCRISELENENERLRDLLTEGKGIAGNAGELYRTLESYSASRMCEHFCNQASVLLQKKSE